MKPADVLTNDLRVALSAKYGRDAFLQRVNVIAMATPKYCCNRALPLQT